MPDSALKPICVPENLKRSTYYSDTYRSQFKLGGTLQMWDVTHISLPFAPEKERLLQERFGFTKEELTNFYENLALHITQDIQLLQSIHDKGDETLSNNVIQYLYIDKIDKPERGSDVYFVSQPLDPIIGSEFMGKDTVTLLNLLQLSNRFAQMTKLLSQENIHIGAFDLDSICLSLGEDGKPLLKLSSLLYGESPELCGLPWLPSAPLTAADCIRQGHGQSINTDLAAISGMLWSLLSGKHFFSKPDLSTPPKYAPECLVDSLRNTILSAESNENTLKPLRAQIFACIKAINNGEMENTLIPYEKEEFVGIPDEPELHTEPEEDEPSEPEIIEPSEPNQRIEEPQEEFLEEGPVEPATEEAQEEPHEEDERSEPLPSDEPSTVPDDNPEEDMGTSTLAKEPSDYENPRASSQDISEEEPEEVEFIEDYTNGWYSEKSSKPHTIRNIIFVTLVLFFSLTFTMFVLDVTNTFTAPIPAVHSFISRLCEREEPVPVEQEEPTPNEVEDTTQQTNDEGASTEATDEAPPIADDAADEDASPAEISEQPAPSSTPSQTNPVSAKKQEAPAPAQQTVKAPPTQATPTQDNEQPPTAQTEELTDETSAPQEPPASENSETGEVANVEEQL